MANPKLRCSIQTALGALGTLGRRARGLLNARFFFGRSLSSVPTGSVVIFPLRNTLLCCGIAGLVAVKRPVAAAAPPRIAELKEAIGRMSAGGREAEEAMQGLWLTARDLRRVDGFCSLFQDPAAQLQLSELLASLTGWIESETRKFNKSLGRLNPSEAEAMAQRIERLRDIAWTLRSEILENIAKVAALLKGFAAAPEIEAIRRYRHINTVLNSIDRMEVRGRDSAGMSLMAVLDEPQYERFVKALQQLGLSEEFTERCAKEPLLNRSLSVHRGEGGVAVAFTYKVAAEIGSLGDNIAFLRAQISADPLLRVLAPFETSHFTVNAHTRWASVGAITEANCHPVDNKTHGGSPGEIGIIHACLNGDIDNFQALKDAAERQGARIHEDVTTDTKIIPLRIEHHLRQGYAVEEAFRRAVNDFEGSHAIAMHTDLAPGRLFLAQRGSGQALFVGIAPDHYMPTSEVYGFIEETDAYIKLDGESVVAGRSGDTQGQIVVLDQQSAGGIGGMRAMYYDGTPLALAERDIKHTELTSRDIDRQGYPHYFMKEISESPASVEKTLQNRWQIIEEGTLRMATVLGEDVVPAAVNDALAEGKIKRIFFIGQGTAGVAALACANILQSYLGTTETRVQAMKASEFSGFALSAHADGRSMADALVIAISQSGTTTDTNRSVDMVRERGAHTLAIVNRRDSDLTFKVNGVIYTSSGRDIEMSVASTKAFYAQIIAGALLGLHIARLKGCRGEAFISAEIEQLLAVPGLMRKVLGMAERIRASAQRLANTKMYWAVVGSGPNKASADEIRIKLSELCYKTISSDFVEDKKHIDLSSEPLILVCAAGTRSTVVSDIIKDTAIFKAHKAAPVVICDDGEDRFNPYAEDVFQVPVVAEHLAPILNTLVGHIWGYYAALSIHDGSRFLYRFAESVRQTIRSSARSGMDIFELVLEKSFRETIAGFYTEFRRRCAQRRFPAAVGYDATSDLTLLLKYLAGRLPMSDFELDFGLKGTAVNMVQVLLNRLGQAIGFLARPVDAIKHQAKTVTVGTSRISERLEGIVFAAIAAENFSIAQLTPSNVVVLKNIQQIISEIEGTVLYRIAGLTLLGEPDEATTIEVLAKRGKTSTIPSRVETDKALKGSKRIIVRQGNVYIGKGRKDERRILVVPLLSSAPSQPNIIEHLLLFHVAFKEEVPLYVKIKALGGKYEHIKSIVQENSVPWEDAHLERVPIDDLFGRSAEKIAESIVSAMKPL